MDCRCRAERAGAKLNRCYAREIIEGWRQNYDESSLPSVLNYLTLTGLTTDGGAESSKMSDRHDSLSVIAGLGGR